jgi:hypothetical protein
LILIDPLALMLKLPFLFFFFKPYVQFTTMSCNVLQPNSLPKMEAIFVCRIKAPGGGGDPHLS